MHTIYQSVKSFWCFSDVYLGNCVLDYIIAFSLFLLIFALFNPVISLILKIISKAVKKTTTDVDDKIVEYFENHRKHALVPLEIVIAIYVAINFLKLSIGVQKILDMAIIILCTFFVVRVLLGFLEYFITNKHSKVGNSDARLSTLYLLMPIMKVVAWVLAAFFVMDNLGYNITAILAGLGIGGVAIALASQSFLSDLISFVSILSDKPIEVGDYISVGGMEGTVKKIGIKSTRLERISGEEVVLPNSKITGNDLLNYKRMNRRRADINLGITMNTNIEILKLIPDIIKKICAEKEPMLEYVNCVFVKISNFSFDMVATYYVNSPEFAVFAAHREYLNYRILEELGKEGIKLAYPTSTVLLDK